jgi:multiple sugar transport system ATP-binding protein
MAAIEFDDVTKVYGGDIRAVSHFSLSVEDGEFVVLLGPSGCGKSTALRMVAGLEAITSGTIRIGGTSVNRVAPRDRDVAMVFQNYALYPHMNVYDNIGFGLRMRGVPQGERGERVEQAAGALALLDQLKRKPSQLSGGQRQRVAMGRAIVREPKAFLMDEPLSNLDARLRVQMRTEIVRIQRNLNVTTLYVTHDQTEAMTMADRVAVMRGGHLQQYDTPDRVYAEPANLFVASFIGSPSMNLLEGRLDRVDGGVRCRVGSQSFRLSETTSAQRRMLEDRTVHGVAVAIRPEALSLDSGASEATLKGTAIISESLGFETLLYVSIDASPVERQELVESTAPGLDSAPLSSDRGAKQASSTTVVARLPAGTSVAEQETVTLAFDPARLQFFDLDNGRALA